MGYAAVQRTAKDFVITRWPSEFDAAWNNIDLLSETSAGLLANLKYNYGLLKDAVDGLDQNKTSQINRIVPTEIEGTVNLLKEVESFAADFVASLRSSDAA
jgi:hypothetical protein